MISADRLEELFISNFAVSKDNTRAWKIGSSAIAGRGIFAARNIKCGEVIFEEAPLIIGPSRDKCDLAVCSICYSSEKSSVCDRGCGLPVCIAAECSQKHNAECETFRSWEPVEPNALNIQVLRLLTVVRATFLDVDQRKLLFSMQANFSKTSTSEIKIAALHFKKFPTEQSTVQYLHSTLAILNTNAFEVEDLGGNDYKLRALYPLAGIMNHECVPNSTYIFQNQFMILKAAKDIKEGQEITNSYTNLLWSNLMRQLYLKMTKQFICKCARCSDLTEKSTYLSALYCKDSECHGLVLPEVLKPIQPDWKCLKCGRHYSHEVMNRTQDIALKTISIKLQGISVKEVIDFLTQKCPSFLPETNHVIVEAKYNVILMTSKCKDDLNHEDLESMKQFCRELLIILNKLEIGASKIRTFLEHILLSK